MKLTSIVRFAAYIIIGYTMGVYDMGIDTAGYWIVLTSLLAVDIISAIEAS